MTSLKMTYFPMKGLGESIRLALTVGGIEFEDERLTMEEFTEKKKTGELPYGQLPVLTIDGVPYAQSNALLRYVGKRTGLYPKDDDIAALRIDGVLDVTQDAIVACFLDKSEDARKSFVDEKIPKFFGPLDRMIKGSGGPFLFGDEMTIADLKLYVTVGMFNGDVELSHVPKGVLNTYENVMALVKAVEENDKVAEWNKSHE